MGMLPAVEVKLIDYSNKLTPCMTAAAKPPTVSPHIHRGIYGKTQVQKRRQRPFIEPPVRGNRCQEVKEQGANIKGSQCIRKRTYQEHPIQVELTKRSKAPREPNEM